MARSLDKSGAGVRIYRNGIDVTSTAATHTNPVTSANNLVIAGDSAAANKFNGQMWNPRIWSLALTPIQQRSLFLRSRHKFGV